MRQLQRVQPSACAHVTAAATVDKSPAASASPERASRFTARCTTTTCTPAAVAKTCQEMGPDGASKAYKTCKCHVIHPWNFKGKGRSCRMYSRCWWVVASPHSARTYRLGAEAQASSEK